MDKIKTLTAENKRLRALNRKLKTGLNMLRTITNLATGLDFTIDDILEAADPIEGEKQSPKINLLAQYLGIRNHGVLVKDPAGDLYFFRYHIPESLPINRIERVLWCEKGEEYIFRRSIEGNVDFLADDPEIIFKNWANCPEIHEFGLIAFLDNCGDVGRSPINQGIENYGIL